MTAPLRVSEWIARSSSIIVSAVSANCVGKIASPPKCVRNATTIASTSGSNLAPGPGSTRQGSARARGPSLPSLCSTGSSAVDPRRKSHPEPPERGDRRPSARARCRSKERTLCPPQAAGSGRSVHEPQHSSRHPLPLQGLPLRQFPTARLKSIRIGPRGYAD